MTGYSDLSNCLASFISEEKMEACGYKCGECKRVDTCTKELTLFRFPTVLVLHLKRFYNSTMRREKLNSTIILPKVLDMSSYAPHSSN